jgi:PIN domain nuclease of toxin-antitoxin system
VTERVDHVVDTHALVWHVTEAPDLSASARAILLDADAGNRTIVVPSIVVVEIVYLVEKGRLLASTLAQIVAYLQDSRRE